MFILLEQINNIIILLLNQIIILHYLYKGDFVAISLFIIGLVETVLGIIFVIKYYRLNGVIAYDNINKLKNKK